MNEGKKVFITFGAGGQNFIDAGNRLIRQAKSTGYFDELILFTDKNLKDDEEFWSQHSEFISNNKRGYGYYIWKSYIIKKTMATMKNGDILMYLDAGCEIGGSLQNEMPKYFDYVKEDKLIGTRVCIEREWNKMDLLMHLDMLNSPLIHTPQHQAGVLLFLICAETKNLVNLWYETSCDYHLIDDSPSVHRNLPCFREHRHDQSIFSLLTKKYGIFSRKNLLCVYVIKNRTGEERIQEYNQ